MDPKQHQLSQLDPQLKEAYEKVMSGIPTPTAPQTPPQTPSPAAAPVFQPIEKPIVQTNPSQKIHLGYQSKPQKGMSPKQKTTIPTPVYVLGAMVFFVLYTLFWLRVFNIAVPFLP